MGDWVNFAEIRAKISLEDVIVRYYGIESLKRDGQKFIGPCPVHGGDSPRAFHADLSKNVWHCFSRCQRGGNQLDFVAAKDQIGIREAALRLKAFFLGGVLPTGTQTRVEQRAGPAAAPPSAPTVGVSPPTPAGASEKAAKPAAAPERATAAPEDEPINPPLAVKLELKSDHPHLIEERKLQLATCQLFGVGYCGRGILRGMIALPIHDEDGELVAYAGRRLKPSEIREHGKYKFPKGFRKDHVLYNYHRAKAEEKTAGLILVEGFFSVLKLHEAGLTNVVAPMGCELSDYQATLLGAASEVVILFDGDEAGTTGAARAAEKLAPLTRVRVAQLPTGLEPDDLSPKALRWIVNGMRALNLLTLAFAFHEQEREGPAAATPAT